MLLYDDHDAAGQQKGVVYALAFSPDGSSVVSAGKDGSLFLRDALGQRQTIIDREPNTLPIHSVVFAEDRSLVVGGAFGWQHLARDAAGVWQGLGPLMTTPTNSLALLDEQTLAVGTGDRLNPKPGAFELWDLGNRRRREPRFPEASGVRAVAVCPARGLVAWATGPRKVCVWDIRKQKKPIELPQPKPCTALSISPDGTHLAAAVDWVVKVLAIEKGYSRFELKHKGSVHAIAYSPDGSTIATGSWDETVKLWDAETGRERATFQWPIGRVHCLAYAPDGLRLAAGGDKGAVVVWDLE